jgi:phage-related protein
MAEAARLHVTLSADTADFTQAIDHAADGLKKSFIPSLVSAELIADGLQAIGSGLVDFAKGAIEHLAEVEQINAQTAAAIKSTGGAAGITAEHMSDLANSIEAATGVSGEMIQKGENLLLTFTNIKNGVGAGNDIFNQTTAIMADMSVALGQDATSSAMQLGKALNDPVKGVSALQKVGVSFTEGQKETIKTLQESGRTMEAQKIILKELNKEFGGSADAFGKTFKGSVEKSSAALENLGDAIFENFMPALKMMADTGGEAMNALATAIADKGLFDGLWSLFGPEMKAAVIGIGAAVTLAVIPALGGLVSAAIAAAVPFVPLIAAAAAIGAAAYLIIRNWDALKSGFNSLLNGLRGMLVTFGNVARGVWDFFVKVALAAFNSLIAPYKAVFDLLPESVKAPLKKLAGNVANTVSSLPQMVVPHIQGMAAGVGSSVSGMVSNVSGFMSQLTTKVKSGFGGLPAHAAAGVAGVADAAAGMGKAAKKAADDAKKHAEDISKAFGDIGGKLKGIDMTAALSGWTALDTIPKKIAALTDGLRGLTEKGVAPTDKRFQGLVSTLKGLQVQMEALDNGQAALKAFSGNVGALTALNREMKDIRERAALFGESINVSAESASALEKTINVLRQSLGATNPIVLKLTEQWKGYRKAADESKVATFDVSKSFADMTKDLTVVDAKAAVLGETFNAGAAKLSIYEKQLEELAANGFSPASFAVWELQQKIEALKPPKPTGFVKFMGDLRDNTTDVMNAVNGLKDGLKTFADGLGVTIEGPVLAAVGKFGDLSGAAIKIGAAVNELTPLLAGLAGFIGTSVVPAIVAAVPVIGTFLAGAFTAVGVAISAAIWPITLIAAGIAGAIIAGQLLYENWEAISAFLLPVWEGIAGVATAVWGGISSVVGGAMSAIWGAISGTWNAITGFLKPLWDGMAAGARVVAEALVAAFAWAESPIRAVWDGITGVFKGAFNAMIATINTLIRGINRIQIQVPDWVPGIGGKGWGGFNIPQIPMLAEGGVIGSPTLAVVGEGKHKEAVLPLSTPVFSQLGAGIAAHTPAYAGGGGDTYITLQYQGSGSRQDAESFMEWMVDELRRRGVKIG